VGRGSSTITAQLKELSKSCGIGENIKFWGYVSERKKFELLSRAWILINPSYHEGWGLVNIEANAVGTPVLGYKVHGMKDSVKNGVTGILVAKGQYLNLAQEAVKLANDPKRYDRFSKSAKKWSRNFNWERATSESLSFIEGLLES